MKYYTMLSELLMFTTFMVPTKEPTQRRWLSCTCHPLYFKEEQNWTQVTVKGSLNCLLLNEDDEIMRER